MVKTHLFLILSITSLLLASCGRKNNASDKKVFRYNEAAGITSLDPAFGNRNIENTWACNHLYNGLVQMDGDLKVQPSIAKNWEISENGKVYTFHLRSDVNFHDHELFEGGKGRRVVARDFEYSFSRIMD